MASCKLQSIKKAEMKESYCENIFYFDWTKWLMFI